MFFKLKNAKEIPREGFTAYEYNSKEEVPEFTSLYVVVDGEHEKKYVKSSHRMYFVIDGKGIFNVGGDEREVEANDVIAIPPKTAYFYRGKMKLFEVNFPGTGSGDAVKVE